MERSRGARWGGGVHVRRTGGHTGMAPRKTDPRFCLPFFGFLMIIIGIMLTAMFAATGSGVVAVGACVLGVGAALLGAGVWLCKRQQNAKRSTTNSREQSGIDTMGTATTTINQDGQTAISMQQQMMQDPQFQQMWSQLAQQMQDPRFQQTLRQQQQEIMSDPQFQQMIQQQQGAMMSNPQYQQMMSNLAQQNPQFQQMMPSMGQQSAGQPYPGSQPYPGPAAAGGFGSAPSAPAPSGPAPPPQYGFTYNTSDNYNTQYSAGTSDLPPPPAYSTVVNEKL
ncbi:uncharacterized protein LOC144881722 isoform X6 [Branchiostoma floridae x Branchiostoma japonicum]